jgi:hypothetical protein
MGNISRNETSIRIGNDDYRGGEVHVFFLRIILCSVYGEKNQEYCLFFGFVCWVKQKREVGYLNMGQEVNRL